MFTRLITKITSLHNSIIFRLATEAKQKTTLVKQLSELANEDGKKPPRTTSGRSWKIDELRIKSNEDLHALWYVCLKEKNLLLSDKALILKYRDKFVGDVRVQKVNLTMRRIKEVMRERQTVRDEYRRKLEYEYIEKKKNEMLQEAYKLNMVEAPEVTWKLMKEKLRALRKGVDNTDYIDKIHNEYMEKRKKKQELSEKFKKPVPEFTSFFYNYLKSGNVKPSQYYILRSHVKNWKQLSFRQKRIVLGFINARRSQDAKNYFVKELRLLGQKIAMEQSKEQFNNK